MGGAEPGNRSGCGEKSGERIDTADEGKGGSGRRVFGTFHIRSGRRNHAGG